MSMNDTDSSSLSLVSSPHHFTDYSYDIIEVSPRPAAACQTPVVVVTLIAALSLLQICRQMEKDPAYSSQPCTSPGSLWSESSGTVNFAFPSWMDRATIQQLFQMWTS